LTKKFRFSLFLFFSAHLLCSLVSRDLSCTALPESSLPMLPLFTRMLTECGTESVDRVAFDRLIHTHTGGVSVSTSFAVKPEGSDKEHFTISSGTDIVANLFVRGKATMGKLTVFLFFSLTRCRLFISNCLNFNFPPFFSLKFASDKIDKLFSIFRQVLTDANLDQRQRVVEMLRESKVRGELPNFFIFLFS
jgi:Zn-dependent M16 (insulinase) family peptidase